MNCEHDTRLEAKCGDLLLHVVVRSSGLRVFSKDDALVSLQIFEITKVAQEEYHVQTKEHVLKWSHNFSDQVGNRSRRFGRLNLRLNYLTRNRIFLAAVEIFLKTTDFCRRANIIICQN